MIRPIPTTQATLLIVDFKNRRLIKSIDLNKTLTENDITLIEMFKASTVIKSKAS